MEREVTSNREADVIQLYKPVDVLHYCKAAIKNIDSANEKLNDAIDRAKKVVKVLERMTYEEE